MKTRLALSMILTVMTGFFLAQEMSLNGQQAPDFKLPTLAGGGDIALKDYRGRVVVLDFWASWCTPCKKSLPRLSKLEEQFPELKILAVSLDDEADSARIFLRQLEVDLTVLHDPEKQVAESYHLTAMPTMMLIDRRGVIRWVQSGYRSGEVDSLIQHIKRVM